jgi:hypothetical protein
VDLKHPVRSWPREKSKCQKYSHTNTNSSRNVNTPPSDVSQCLVCWDASLPSEHVFMLYMCLRCLYDIVCLSVCQSVCLSVYPSQLLCLCTRLHLRAIHSNKLRRKNTNESLANLVYLYKGCVSESGDFKNVINIK